MKDLVISHKWSIELGLSEQLYTIAPAFCHTQHPSGLFAYSPEVSKEGNVN
ncbi:hypothetical protein [Bacillus cereus group sp. TH152-1LC]|uniref:hypothetical protein n=1 Tax=Bacillus cereus group sp. TH152-1LC TaxID=3018060 RepID=UPI0022E2C3C9|nr:hypothetical protein [Bacillus cereus group sp. TH152-1LC]MDA1675457.1 hypothetical protein [Bacillus cereus group sp. TH152-1LC]